MQTKKAAQKPRESYPSILVIEDDKPVAQVLKFMLEQQNYDATIITDGRAARTQIKSSPNPPALILLDVVRPYVDGFELLGLIRTQNGWTSTPVIVLTAKTSEQDIVRALDAGANEYIVKPFQPDELLALIGRYLQKVP